MKRRAIAYATAAGSRHRSRRLAQPSHLQRDAADRQLPFEFLDESKTGTYAELTALPTADVVQALTGLEQRCRHDVQLRRALLERGRLSPTRVGAHLSISFIGGDLPRMRGVNRAWRQLKFTAEGISPDESVRSREIAALRDVIVAALDGQILGSRTEFFRRHTALYQQISRSPYSVFAFRAAGIVGGRPDYWYLTDDELVALAARYESFTALKMGDDMLHRHIVGLDLERAVIAANPNYAKHFRIGHGGFRYRSEAELIIGNLLHLNAVAVRREVLLSGLGSRKKRAPVADFQFLPGGQILEIAQNTRNDRGSRRQAYVRRHNAKVRLYELAGVSHLAVDADDFYVRGVFDALAWANRVRNDLLSAFGIDIGPIRAAADLLFEDCADKRLFISASQADVMRRLEELGIASIAKLQNHHSWILTCLKYRPDAAEILESLKQASIAQGVVKRVATRARNRGAYASLDQVRAFCREHGIRSQKQWVAFAKAHRQDLLALHIPSNLYQVYGDLGTWKSWPDVLAPS